MQEIKNAIRNAAEKAANAKSLEEAQGWQSIITNLTSTLQLVGEDNLETKGSNEVDKKSS